MIVRIIVGLVSVVVFAISIAASYIIGGIQGQRELYHRQYLEERMLITPLLPSDSVYNAIELRERSNGGVDLWGELPTVEDRDRLLHDIREAFGAKRASEIMQDVSVSRDAA